MGVQSVVAGDPAVVFDNGGWWVLVESDNGTQQYRCSTESQARRFAETLGRQIQMMVRMRSQARATHAAQRDRGELPPSRGLKSASGGF